MAERSFSNLRLIEVFDRLLFLCGQIDKCIEACLDDFSREEAQKKRFVSKMGSGNPGYVEKRKTDDYNELCSCIAEFQSQTKIFSEEEKTPISLFIMRSAAKEGLVKTIPQAQSFFLIKFNLLKTQDPMLYKQIQEEIEKEKEKKRKIAEIHQRFFQSTRN